MDAVWRPCYIGASGLRREDADTEEAKTYAMLMADTVLVKGEGEAPEVLTTAALRSWKDNAYFFKVAPSCLAICLRLMAALHSLAVRGQVLEHMAPICPLGLEVW